MIATLLRIGWLNLRRDRVAQALTFVLPIVFFSIFASVFGGQGSGTSRIRVAVVDEDHSELSARIVAGLAEGDRPARAHTPTTSGARARSRRRRAAGARRRRAGRGRDPAGHGRELWRRAASARGAVEIQLLADVSDPIAPQMVLGPAAEGHDDGGAGSDDAGRHAAVREARRRADAAAARGGRRLAAAAEGTGHRRSRRGAGDGAAAMGVSASRSSTSWGATPRRGSLVSFYAAGIGVMFLLFSCVAGAGGALLDEVEAGTLERLLSTRLGMTRLLLGQVAVPRAHRRRCS